MMVEHPKPKSTQTRSGTRWDTLDTLEQPIMEDFPSLKKSTELPPRPVIPYDENGSPVLPVDEDDNPFIPLDDDGRPVLPYDDQGMDLIELHWDLTWI